MFLLTIEVADPANVARHFHAADAVVDKLRTYAPAASAHIHRLPKLRGQCVMWSFHTPGSVELTQFFGDTRRVVLFHGEALELPAGKEAEAIHGHWKEEDPPLAWIEGLDG